MNINYDLKLEEIIKENNGRKPSVLLHSCCAPCSSSVIERLLPYFDITIFYYNPNIEPEIEYIKRKEEEKRFITNFNGEVKMIDCDWENEEFKKMAKGMEDLKEGGLRCHKCYTLRLEKTAFVAKQNNFEYFGTTLTVSPYKNSQVLNQIGGYLSNLFGVKYLYSDFKKKEGYKRSIELSKEYNLYRQDYCGCIFSQREKLNKNVNNY